MLLGLSRTSDLYLMSARNKRGGIDNARGPSAPMHRIGGCKTRMSAD